MEPVEYRDMAYIMAVYEEKSFRAAIRCFVSQPSLSKAVKKVEKNLGCLIFDRSSTPVEATPDGKNIIAYFRKMMTLHKKLEIYCEGLKKQRKADLIIGAPSFFCTYLLPPVISDFQIEHPGCQIKVIESNDIDLREFLKAGIVDVGLSVEDDMPPEMVSVDLKEENIVLAVPSEYNINQSLGQYALTREALVKGNLSREKIQKLPMNLFSKERFLLLKRENDIYRRSMEICHDAGFEPLVVMELDQLLTAYYLAAAGEGIAFIRSSIPHYVEDLGRLRFYYIDHPATTRLIRMFYNSETALITDRNNFINYLKKYLFPG